MVELSKLERDRSLLSQACQGALHLLSEMAATAEKGSASLGVIAQSIEQISRGAADASNASSMLRESIEGISRELNAVVDGISSILNEAEAALGLASKTASASSQINGVVDLIKKVSQQTHILALNASIEAARVGAAGAGFAVVASEVKRLAGRTSEATTKIEAEIKEIQTASQSTVSASQSISQNITNIKRRINVILSTMVGQEESAAGIALAVDQTEQGVSGLKSAVEAIKTSALGNRARAQKLTGDLQAALTAANATLVA
jgi:methyl-accepting chemotaxis protein